MRALTEGREHVCRNCALQIMPDEGVPHVCPPPMPYAWAQGMAKAALSSGTPLHPRTKARIILGLKSGKPTDEG